MQNTYLHFVKAITVTAIKTIKATDDSPAHTVRTFKIQTNEGYFEITAFGESVDSLAINYDRETS